MIIKYAVIIKHPFRDGDYRVDIVEAHDTVSAQDIKEVIMREMLGPFQVEAITSRIGDRDISKGLDRLKSDSDSHAVNSGGAA